ncbi:MAG: RDD family protein [Bacteroidota bacterium]
MEPNENPASENDLFDEMPYKLVQASMGKRFLNYLIDVIVFGLLLFIALMITATIDPTVVEAFIKKNEAGGFSFVEQLMIQAIYGTYMFIVEALFKGKSLGKLITGTRAVRQDGTPFMVRDAQLRGLCRMVPFNAFSALGTPSYPWHDRWTKTFVIDEQLSQIPDHRLH